MGRSSKSVFKTLISSVKSFNKEKKEPSDKVQTTRKGHQGRCMWSLGKSSSRSSEDMDMEEIKYVQIQKEPEQEANLEQVLDNLEAVEEIKVVHKVEVEKEKEKEKVEVDKLKVEVEEEFEEQKELDKEEIEEQKELDNEVSNEQKERDKEEEEPEEQKERGKEALEEQKELVKEEFEAQKELDNEEFEEQKELDKEEFEEQKELEKVELEEQKESDEVYLNELVDQKGITQQKELLLLVIRATLKIQAAFRHHLARRRAVRALKALVRLQALVRGRIVRRAMVRLRCINALIKVQSIVRGYLVRKSDIGLMVQRHLNQTKQLRIETEQGDIYNTITNDEVEEQHDEVPYNNGKEMGHHTFKTTVTVKQEVIADQGDSVRGSINVGSVYNRPYVDTLLLKQEENLKKVIICNEDDDDDDVSSSITKDVVEDPGSCSSAMSFSMKDEDECSELSISMKEQEECSELSFPMKEQEEIGIASAFSSSSEAITMQPAAIPSLTPPPTLSSIPNATLENFSIGGTNITTPIQVGGPGVNGDTMQVSRNDLVAIMPEQPRPSVSDDNEHIKAKSLYGSANCGTYLAVTDLRFIKDAMHEQNDSLMRSKQEQGECDAMNSRLIDEVTNKHMGTAMNSKEEEEPESPSPRLVVPNYMATTKSSKAKKVVGSPKPMKTDPLGLRADSLNHIQDFLKPRQDSPKLRQASPKLRQDSPKMKHNSPKPRLDSPKMRLDSPKHNKQEDSPKHKQDSPNLVKLDPLSMKRRHSLSVLEGKSGLSSLTQRSVL